ncbi:MAG TPA: selenide, water dikinase SelD [Flavisolibacter sp.]|nr:selenide, water dikinase SelD [Flavisolibacter sp.]
MEEGIRLTQYSKGGGCGCKIAPSVLQQIIGNAAAVPFQQLLVGNESSDDAAVFKTDEENAIVLTTDFFLPIVDDPFDFGRIASANAISDVYAMGGVPLMAIAILGWPIEKLPVEFAQRILDGARTICKEANIPLAGGHTIDSNDPIFGLAVTGTVKIKNLKKNNTAKAGDLLLLTKPVGSGLLSTALKRSVLQPAHYDALLHQLTQLNKVGLALARIPGVNAMTDVTGFGMLGHLIEMADGSGLSAELRYGAIKKIEGTDEYLKQRTIPDATFRNWNSYSSKVTFEKGVNVMEAFNVLPDPQTNGGLLVSVDESALDTVVSEMKKAGLEAFTQPVGKMVDKKEKSVTVIL